MPQRRPARAAFTLIELLVVIAIIAVLVGLTAAAVMKMVNKGPEAQNRSDVTGLVNALGQAREQYNLKYIPSRLALREDNNYTMTDPLEKKTPALLQQMFGRRVNIKPGVNVDWNNDGTISSTALVLEGHQCLVFFLGGIPSPSASAINGCTGFSQDPVNPAAAGGPRYGPHFNFKSGRLVRASNGFFSYLDAYGKQPFAYFSSTKGNDYSPYGTSDCNSLGVSPYALSTTPTVRYVNPDGFQIVSAGADKLFGPGGVWDPASGTLNANGRDDISNFSGLQLGAPQR